MCLKGMGGGASARPQAGMALARTLQYKYICIKLFDLTYRVFRSKLYFSEYYKKTTQSIFHDNISLLISCTRSVVNPKLMFAQKLTRVSRVESKSVF